MALSEADFQQTDAGELSEDELDAVAGGKNNCVCPLAGGGEGTSPGEEYLDKVCVCVMGGGQTQDGKCRCACVMSGEGMYHIS